MDIKLETIGNATLIVSENNKSILSTDPWFDSDDAYFGSWRLSHKFPMEQREKVENSKYIFISHFHPDHLNLISLKHCKKTTILLAQHYASRVENDLRRIGFNVISLPSRKWINIGEKTRIMIFNNERQDSALLIELKDRLNRKSLVLNLNDSGGYGFEKEVATIAKKYKNSFYLQLHGWGDADMINLFDKEGIRIAPIAIKKFPVGKDIKAGMKKFNCNVAIPFSCHHQYQRRDSFWANEFVTPVDLMIEGFDKERECILLPAFQKLTFDNGTFHADNINPEKLKIVEPLHESIFGDDWNEILTKNQINQGKDYFAEIKILVNNYKSIILRVGGIEHEMLKFGRGKAKIKFEVPSFSLMKSIRGETFDDLLISNFMRTQLINCKDLYTPDFTMSVCKYSDNGGAKSLKELEKYHNFYNNQRELKDKLNLNFLKFKSILKSRLNNNLIFKLKSALRK